MAYAYFKAATKSWLKENRKTQNWLALEIQVEDGTISKYLGSTIAPFEKQVKIAKACGHEYLSFLEFGKSILERSSKDAKKENGLPEEKIAPVKTRESSKEKGAAMIEAEKDLIDVLKDQVTGLKADKVILKDFLDDLRHTVKKQASEIEELRFENKQLHLALGEAQRRLNILQEKKARSQEENQTKPAANQ